MTCVNLRSLAYWQTCSSLRSRRGQKATLWKTIMSSFMKAQIFVGGLSWVVMRILTGPSFSRMELNSSNMASSQSSTNSTPPSCLSSIVMGTCLSSAGSFFLSLRSFIWSWFLTIFLLYCTSTRFILFLISLGCFLQAVLNSSIDLGRGLKGFFFLLPASSLWVCLTTLGIVVCCLYNININQRASDLRLPLIIIIHNQMEPTFSNKEIIWAKVKGYPWWPAKINKLPTPDANVFKVEFIAEDTHAFLNPRDVKKYEEHYEECSKKKMRGLAPAIQSADQLHKKLQETIPKTLTHIPSEKKTRFKPTPKKKPIKRRYHKRNEESSNTPSEDEPCSESEKEKEKEKKVELPKQDIVQQQPLIEKEEKIEKQEKPEKAEKPEKPEKPDKKQKKEKMKEQQKMQVQGKMQIESKGKQDKQEKEESVSEDNIEQEKFMIESEEKVDRNKIDGFEQGLFKIVESIKQKNYTFRQQDFIGLQSLNGDELLIGKITNLLSFIITKMNPTATNAEQDIAWLKNLRDQLKQKIVSNLYDTSYYDQYIKLIQKNKKSRNQYENKLMSYLKSQYRIKKELALVFASRLVAQINNGAICREKELLEDIKEHKLDLLNVSNKAAIDRAIEALVPKYM